MGSPGETPELVSNRANGPYAPLRALSPLPAEWRSLPRAFVIRPGPLVQRGHGRQHGGDLDLWQDAHQRPGPGPRPGSKLGAGETRRSAGPSDRPGRRGQSGRDALGQRSRSTSTIRPARVWWMPRSTSAGSRTS